MSDLLSVTYDYYEDYKLLCKKFEVTPIDISKNWLENLTILEELTVEKVIIAKQNEESENYKKFLEIVNQNKIKVIEVEAGDKIKIEEDIYFDIIWPLQNQITQNVLNNNAIVAKLNYKKIGVILEIE